MNCMNCGTTVSRSTEYCPQCGFHVLSQRKAIYLSKLYYNQGLEKATVRDLSGAISCLKQSLKFSKLNIPARNLLGLVYFETGEVVAALCEWVISKNLMPEDNLATHYIDSLQSNPAKLEVINRTVDKYNLSLSYCRQGNEDMAMIQLKKLLSQNPRLIKGYHLLALLQIRDGAYTKARRTLKKALKIDKTNTTTLRFLREVDEQTGMTTDLSGRTRKAEVETDEPIGKGRVIRSGNDLVILPPVFRESSAVGFVINLVLGGLIGAAAMWFLVVPAATQNAYDSVNQKLRASGDVYTAQEAQIEQLEQEAKRNEENSEDVETQVQTANVRADSAEKLLQAYAAMNSGDYSTASTQLQGVQEADLSEGSRAIYQSVLAAVGSGSDGEQSAAGGDEGDYDSGSSESDVSGYDSGYDSGNDSENDSGSDSGYDSGGDSDNDY